MKAVKELFLPIILIIIGLRPTKDYKDRTKLLQSAFRAKREKLQ